MLLFLAVSFGWPGLCSQVTSQVHVEMNSTHPLDSRQLRAFVTLAKEGSFTRSATFLGLSQSAVSHSIKALEKDLNCRLLSRVGKKVALTQPGEHLLGHAEKILREMESARLSMDRLSKWGRGMIRIGASVTACQHLLPTVLEDFKDNFPQYMIRVEPGDTRHLIGLLRDRRIDIALTLEPLKYDEFEFIPMFQDELVFLCSPKHAWVAQGKVEPLDIPSQQFILYNKSSYTFRMIESYFARMDIDFDAIIELGSMEAIKELAKLNLGVTVLAPWIARQEIESGSLIPFPLGPKPLIRNWGILHHLSQRLSLAEETFISLCRAATLPYRSLDPSKNINVSEAS